MAKKATKKQATTKAAAAARRKARKTKASAKKSENTGKKALGGNSPKRSGRPAGSRNIERPETETELSQCRRCGSTEKRSVGQGPMVQEHRGIHHGRVYTHILRRRVICKTCGQHRIDVSHENRPEKKK